MNRYDYHKPGTIEEAVSLMAALDGAKYIAGGTDVMVLLRQKRLALKNLILLWIVSILPDIVIHQTI